MHHKEIQEESRGRDNALVDLMEPAEAEAIDMDLGYGSALLTDFTDDDRWAI